MRLIAILPVRNESWVLALSARALLRFVDVLVILDHASTDGTADIMRDLADEPEYAHRLVFMADSDPTWREMAHRQKLLEMARRACATHVLTMDADEILTGNLLPTIRGLIEQTPPGHILQLPGYNLRGGLDRYHANGIWGNRHFSVAFADDPSLSWTGDQFHHREPFGMQWQPYRPVRHGEGGVMHLWGVDEWRLVARHALYKCVEALRWPSKPVAEIEHMYNLAIHEAASVGTPYSCVWKYASVPDAWWEPYRDLLPRLDLDAAPWQEDAVARLIEEHGAERFRGLDLFGIGEPVCAEAIA